MPLPETFVAVAPDNLGKKIRNLQITQFVQQTDGTWAPQTVLAQVVQVADSLGNVLDLDALEHLGGVREELARIRGLLEQALSVDELDVTDPEDPDVDDVTDEGGVE